MNVITVKSEQRHLPQDFRAHKQRDAGHAENANHSSVSAASNSTESQAG
jgi:hypothetical protein